MLVQRGERQTGTPEIPSSILSGGNFFAFFDNYERGNFFLLNFVLLSPTKAFNANITNFVQLRE